MNNSIEIIGVETNNLKNINVSIVKGGINLIIGPSGSGKSSLAYDTIAQIGQHEFFSMFADDISEPTYKVKQYKNMIATIPIKQLNHNNNLRSTIGTYFGLNYSIIFLFSSLLEIDEDFFVLNKSENLCEFCHGFGFTKELDLNKIISYDIPIYKNPLRCWNKHKDFYCEILKLFCAEKDIDSSKTFRELNAEERNTILLGESTHKYSVKYKRTNTVSSRTTKYYGILTGKAMMQKYVPGKQFFSEVECRHCVGKKYSKEHNEHLLLGQSIGSVMTLPFNQLAVYCKEIRKICKEEAQILSLNKIENFICKAIELGLSHLFFHRAIPTLSGGELQRLRLVQVFSSQLSDLLLILDEPLAGLSGSEKIAVYQNTLKLANHHTLIIVDHSDIFVNKAQNIIALGEKSGKYGGNLINAQEYLESQIVTKQILLPFETKIKRIEMESKVYGFKGIGLTIAVGSLNLITGKSGVGKSTLLREYLPQCLDSYEYISQKPLMGNKNSSVATVLNVFIKIIDLIAKNNNIERRVIINLVDGKGCCPKCGGSGYREYGYEPKVQLICKDCNGTGFNAVLKKYKIKGETLFDIWELTITEAKDFFHGMQSSIENTLSSAESVLLGHLKIGQPTATLSGGENIRLKVLNVAKTSKMYLGIDEPFKGLASTEVDSIMQLFYSLLRSNKTLIIVEHNEQAFEYCHTKSEIIEENQYLIAKDIR